MDCGAIVMLLVLCIEGKAELDNADGDGRGNEKVGCEVVDILSVSSIDDDGDAVGGETTTAASGGCFSPAKTVVGATVSTDVIFVVGANVVGGSDIVGTKVTSCCCCCCCVGGSLDDEDGDSDAASASAVVGMMVDDDDDGGDDDGSSTSSSSSSPKMMASLSFDTFSSDGDDEASERRR